MVFLFPLAAFVAGILSFLSPCVLPLVPGYVSLISGATVEDLQSDDRRMLGTVMLHSLTFILGFSVVFIALGAVATGIGQFANEYHNLLAKFAGIIVIVFGLHLTGLLKIKALYADKRLHDVKGGSSALGRSPSVSPSPSAGRPASVPFWRPSWSLPVPRKLSSREFCCLQSIRWVLAVPFLLTSLGVDRFLGFYGRFRRHLHTVEVISGVLLIAVGVLIFMNNLKLLVGLSVVSESVCAVEIGQL